MGIQSQLKVVHDYLMNTGFPYHSVSVIHRPQDLGFHVMFMESVRNLVTKYVIDYLEYAGFTYSFVKDE